MKFFYQFSLFSLLLSKQFCAYNAQTEAADDDDENEDANKIGIEEEERGWKLEMVDKLRFNLSKNAIGIDHKIRTVNDPTRPSTATIENADIRLLYGISNGYHPNMNITFDEKDDFSVICQIAIFSDEEYQREEKIMTEKDMAYCGTNDNFKPICKAENGNLEMRKASGTYNEPSRTPICLYDFYEMAKLTREYELFKYCAKGYFYQGKDYDDPKALQHRNDWILYLTNGMLICDISQTPEYNQDLLARGYEIELVQSTYTDKDTYCEKCKLSGIASSYTDKRKDGKFILGGIIGSMLLENEENSFWNDAKMDKLQTIKGVESSCLFLHHRCLRGEKLDKRYNLELVISHYCTDRGMLGKVRFNVALGPEQVPTQVFEDTKVRIFLDSKEMRRSTGKIIKGNAE